MKEKLERAKHGFVQIKSSQEAIIDQIDALEAKIDDILGMQTSYEEGLREDEEANRPHDHDASKEQAYWNMITISREMHKSDRLTNDLAKAFEAKAENDRK